MFLRSSWYVAAWDHEVSDNLLARRLLGDPVVLYRQADGTPAAIGNRCPHRFAPLSLGKHEGDVVRCGYHGLAFNASGRCVNNLQGAGHIPEGAAVPSYPAVERDHLIWVWMGEASTADPATIPDLFFMRRPGAHTAGEYLHVRSSYQLVVDNLMDLTHAATLHRDTVGLLTPDLIGATMRVEQSGERVTAAIQMNNVVIPDIDGTVDQWLDISWRPPSIMEFKIGHVPSGTERAPDAGMIAVHAVTPETEHTSHYFFCNSAQPRLKFDSDATTERDAIRDEDEPMLAACEGMMEGNGFWSLKPAILPSDAAAVRVRRMLDKMGTSKNPSPKWV